MNENKTVVLDLTGCKYYMELHMRIKKAFDFPDFYGMNWDAFWDMLSMECDAEKVEIIGEDTLPKDLKKSLQMIHEILTDCKDFRAKYGEKFDFEVIS